MTSLQRTFTLFLVSTALLATGCGAPEPESEPVSTRHEIPELQIALATLPEPFTIESGADGLPVLVTDQPDGRGTIEFLVGPLVPKGINLVEEVKQRRRGFEELPDGRYHGNRELGTPIGAAYTARGSYTTETGEAVEETWIYALHPVEDRLLNLIYRYPVGVDSSTRVSQLLTVLGEVEGMVVISAEAEIDRGAGPDLEPEG